MTRSFRQATAGDHALYASLFPDLAVDDPVPGRERFAAEIAPSSFVVEVDGSSVGWGLIEILDGVGYVRQVMVASTHRGQGLGRALMLEAARRMAEAGCATWRLNVKPDNAPAVGLYRSLGMRPHHRSMAVRLPWERAEDLPSDPSIEVSTIEASDHDALEPRFGLPPGQLASLLAQPERRGRWARRRAEAGEAGSNEAAVGLAVFDPRFPGCFPFHADTPAVARALIEHLMPHRPPSSPWLQLVVEDAVALAEALVGAGARNVLDFEHYRGSLSDVAGS